MSEIQISGLSIEETKQIVPSGTFLLGYAGSITHNTKLTPDDPCFVDDTDIMGVMVGSVSEYIGITKCREQKVSSYKEYDVVVYEARKYFSLLLKQNPNVLSLLWLPENYYIYRDWYGKALCKNRDIFVSKKAYHSFIGYAHGQLHRMTHQAYQGYMGQKRKGLVDMFGYDTKNAAHLIRLLRMGIEYLTDGVLHVSRDDAEELKGIKRGKWTLEKVQGEADSLFALAREAYVKSPLPFEPDYDKADNLLINIIGSMIRD